MSSEGAHQFFTVNGSQRIEPAMASRAFDMRAYYVGIADQQLVAMRQSMHQAGLTTARLDRVYNNEARITTLISPGISQILLDVVVKIPQTKPHHDKEYLEIQPFAIVGDVGDPTGALVYPAVWDSSGKVTVIGLAPGHSLDWGIRLSADGGTVMGWGAGTSPAPFAPADGWLWTEADGFTMLNVNPTNSYLIVCDMSDDAGVVVGSWQNNSTLMWEAFYWTPSTGKVTLPKNAGEQMILEGVSGDGKIAVGYRYTVGGVNQGFIYTLATGVIENITHSSGNLRFFAASFDGSVITGDANYGAIKWTRAGGIESIGGGSGQGYCISADGQTIAGNDYAYGYGNNYYYKLPWFKDTKHDIHMLPDAGYVYTEDNLPNGGEGGAVYGMSPDGQDFVGWVMGSDFRQLPSRWDKKGKLTLLELPSWSPSGTARDVAKWEKTEQR